MKAEIFSATRGWGQRSLTPRPRGTIFTPMLPFLIWMVVFLITPVVGPDSVQVPSAAPAKTFSSQCNLRVDKDVKERRLYIHDREHSVTIMTSNRTPHKLLTEVTALFLQQYLGYVHVIITYADAFFPEEILQHLGINDYEDPDLLDLSALINMEVWVPPEYNMGATLSIQIDSVLGAGGRFGWFFPKYLVDKRGLFDHWRVFAASNSSAVSIFSRTAEELDLTKGQRKDPKSNLFYCDSSEESRCHEGVFTPPICATEECAILFASYLHSSDFLLDQIIDMSLRVKVAWLGPNLNEEFIKENVNIKGGRSVLVFHFTPDAILRPFDFTSVSFPSCTDYVKSFNKSYFCNYEMHLFHKFIWTGLQKADSYLHESLKRIYVSGADYQNLLDEYISLPNRSIATAACNWMTKYRESWSLWQDVTEKTSLYLLGLIPINASGEKEKFLAPGNVPAFNMALEDINANDSILPNHVIGPVVANTECEPDIVMLEFITFIKSSTDTGTYNKIIGIVGPACSDTIEPLAGVSKFFRIPIISYGAEGAIFSDREQYPYFFRTIPENKIFRQVYLQLLTQMKWRRVASLTEDGQQYSQYLTPLQDLLQSNGISFNMRKYPQERESDSMKPYLEYMKKKKYTIIIGDFYQNVARSVFCDAREMGMTGYQKYVWFLPRWFSHDWYNMTKWVGKDAPCTTEQMEEALQGHMSLSYRYFAADDSPTPANITVKEWRERYKKRAAAKDVLESDYAGYTYDAVWTYALALNKLFNEDYSYTSNLRSPNTTKKFVHYINTTKFDGVSGHINFTNGPSRITDIVVWQFINKSYKEVGVFYPNPKKESNGRLVLHKRSLYWPSGETPTDGREECNIEYFRKMLGENTSCHQSLIVLCTLVFAFISLILVVGVIVLKRRYDSRLRQMEEMFKNQSIFKKFEGWEISRNKIVTSWKLGEGQFGKVYGGECLIDSQGWRPVAVKTLKMGATISEKVDFLTEAEVMKGLKHENVVELVGVCNEGEPICTIMEFMLYGDLHTYLLARRNLVYERNRNDDDEVSNRRLTSMALDVAKALTYLSELNFVHRDVACRNCLVSSHRVVKLADFGMTRPLNENNYYRFSRLGLLPVRWMAMESLAKGVYTTMSDMWSYGILLYEIITFGAVPFQDMKNNQVYDRVKAGHTLTIPAGIHTQLAVLLQQCWHPTPEKRPIATQVMTLLRAHPCLISPSLDEPQSSVTVDSQVSLEVRITDRDRGGGGVGGSNRKPSLGTTNQQRISNGPQTVSANRKRSMSGNMVLTVPPHLGGDESAILSSNLEALNLNHTTAMTEEEDTGGGEDPLLPPAKYVSSRIFKQNGDGEYISRDLLTGMTSV